MMNNLKLIITGILLGASLFLWPDNGQALVSLKHYEKMKMQDRMKTKESEKVPTQEPIKLQVHRPGDRRPATGKAGSK
jgi:hypothetical protein